MSLIEKIQGTAPEKLSAEIAESLSFDKTKNRWIIEDLEAGEEYEYNAILERWVPILEEEQDGEQGKRSLEDKDASEELKRHKKQRLEELRQEKQRQKEAKQRRNTCVYVSGLPLDTDLSEIVSVFGKYGILAEDFNTGDKKIKMYRDEDGRFKGDCLVEYLREESCLLAIELLDKTRLRVGDAGEMRVSKAQFSENKKPVEAVKKMNLKEKSRLRSKISEINRRATVWSDDENSTDDETRRLREEKIVILRHCFTPEEVLDAEAVLDIKDDIREGCEEIGEVTKVEVYDLEPEGIVSVRFKSAVAADRCVERMEGRYFGGQRLSAAKYDGHTRYRKSESDSGDAGEVSEKARLEKFGDWLENSASEPV